MENKTDIKNLFDRFNRNALSPAELRDFFKLIEENNTALDDLFIAEWEGSSRFSGEFKALPQLEKIRGKLLQQSQPQKLSRRIVPVLKYAAVLLLGFGLSWYINSAYFSKESAAKDIKYCTINVAYGSKTNIQLPDGSTVYLNSGSSLTYPAQFDGPTRSVILKGEGYFNVSKDAERPFYVNTNKIIVKVLGTSFNIKAYPDEKTTETTLITGKIEIYKNENIPLQNLNKRIAILQPSQKATVINETITLDEEVQKPVAKTRIPLRTLTIENSAKPELFTDWRHNVLIFNNEKFTDIIKILERWYDVEIALKNKNLYRERFSGKFDRESVSEVLDALAMIQNFKYEIHKNRITIF